MVGKQHFTLLYSRARAITITPRNIKSGWSKCGLFPFDPDRVLGEIQKSQEGNLSRTSPSPVRGEEMKIKNAEIKQVPRALGIKQFLNAILSAMKHFRHLLRLTTFPRCVVKSNKTSTV
jgi:hypothetical protein